MHHLLRRAGFLLRHCSGDAVIARLDDAREVLRLNEGVAPSTLHELGQIALATHLRGLLARNVPDLVVDVGANRGQFARQIRALGFTGPILSFEPQQRRASQLQAEATLTDPHWEIIPAAVGDSTGQVELETFADDVFSSLHKPTEAALDRFGPLLRSTGRETVPLTSLDDVLATPRYGEFSRILLKSDTQGHDLAVLHGARRTLARTCIVLAEASLVPLYDETASPAALGALLTPVGFRSAGCYAIAHDDRDLSVLEVDCLFVRPVSASA